MTPFSFYLLSWPAIAIFLSTLAVSIFATKRVWPSILLAFFKSTIFLLYYGLIFDGTFTFLDDWSYLEGGFEILHNDIRLSNIFENWQTLLSVGKGEHFLYYLQNAYAISIFGEGYFAPPALNSIITLFIALLGKNLSRREFSFSDSSSRFLFYFLIVHPDILAWSTVMNGKDTTVLLLHITLLLSISLFFRKSYFLAGCLAVLTVATLFFFRFYVPLIFALALTISTTMIGIRSNGQIITVSLIALIAATFLIGESQILYAIDFIKNNASNPLLGLLRTTLTPIPFNTNSNYAFLDIPAFIHWLLIPFTIAGSICIYRLRTPFSKFFLIYFLLFVILYSLFIELQGPRHRLQLGYAFAIFQFTGLSLLLNKLKHHKRNPRKAPQAEQPGH